MGVNTLLALENAAQLGSPGLDLTRYMVVVGILLAVLVGGGILLRRAIAGSMRVRSGKRSLAVLDVLPLGGKRRLAVVRCYDRTFALGMGDKEVSLVAELDGAIGQEATPTNDTEPFERLFEVARSRLALRRRGEKPEPVGKQELVG